MRKRPIGRPPRKPGLDYRIKDIPAGDFRRFRASLPKGKTVRAALIDLIRAAGNASKDTS